jgi:hypothetical protein
MLTESSMVWRYMSFSRFMWLLQNKQLWLARADTLEDQWELAITDEEIEYLAARTPATSSDENRKETKLERTKRISQLWRTTTFVNCWCALEYESHALWRVFCGSREGVAIQTSWSKLNAVTEDLRVAQVVYSSLAQYRDPELERVVLRKRRMYEYENEVRIIAHHDTPSLTLIKGELGFRLPFDPGRDLDWVFVHPESDQSFMDVVLSAVDHYSPTLRGQVVPSRMKELPPLLQS